MVDRYGAEIDSDLLHYYGIDLFGLFQDEYPIWRYLIWIDRLPRNSRLWSAIADDPDAFDESELDRQEDRKPSNPKMHEFGPTEERLAAIEDRLGEIRTVLIAANSDKKPPGYKPVLRPVFRGYEEAKQRRLIAQHEFLKNMLLPKSG